MSKYLHQSHNSGFFQINLSLKFDFFQIKSQNLDKKAGTLRIKYKNVDKFKAHVEIKPCQIHSVCLHFATFNPDLLSLSRQETHPSTTHR